MYNSPQYVAEEEYAEHVNADDVQMHCLDGTRYKHIRHRQFNKKQKIFVTPMNLIVL